MVRKYSDYEIKPFELDEKDRRILQLLNKNARISLTKISRKTGIPIDTVRYRIRQMEENEVFNYAVIINPPKMGYPLFNVLYLQLINFSAERETKLVAYVESHPHLVYASKISGKYDFAVGVVAKNMLQFDAIVNDFKTEFSSIIKDIDIFHITKEYKYDYMLDLI